MRSLLRFVIFALLMTLAAEARSIEEIQASGEIVVAVYEDFPPYSYMENGEAKGIDVEIAKRIAKSLNVKPKWYFTGADENLDDDLRNIIWKGNIIHKTKADVMMRVPYDYDYMRRVDPSTGGLQSDMVVIKAPYHSEKWVIITHKERLSEINSLGVFTYNTIGVEIDTMPDKHMSALNGGILNRNIRRYFKFKKAIKDFKAGKIDALAGLQSQLQFLLDYKDHKDIYYLTNEIIGVKSVWDIGIAVRTDFRALSYHIDGVIAELYEENTLQEIFTRYHVTYNKPLSYGP